MIHDIILNHDIIEILRSMLYRGSDMIRDIEWVIFDEVHCKSIHLYFFYFFFYFLCTFHIVYFIQVFIVMRSAVFMNSLMCSFEVFLCLLCFLILYFDFLIFLDVNDAERGVVWEEVRVSVLYVRKSTVRV